MSLVGQIQSEPAQRCTRSPSLSSGTPSTYGLSRASFLDKITQRHAVSLTRFTITHRGFLEEVEKGADGKADTKPFDEGMPLYFEGGGTIRSGGQDTS